ncbi:hypothetical protein LNV09_23060 [Paucibacter sp. B2R-40]|uniref:hypothetical protein n=1 Tax=Paucibacter sp. B2R-40 TaxID=2893554 RepID=UPI0021E46710|nr:hypothetical protein [Paucibacter sp. B2R-40]MCV2357034.1 hypothetical protein [Paucibacter sp. B2R-40]
MSFTKLATQPRVSLKFPSIAWICLAAAIAMVGVIIHIGAIFGGASWFKFFGAPPAVVESSRTGTLLAPVGSAAIAALMALCAAAAFSALGHIPRLPMLRLLLVSIAGISLLRAFAVIPVAFLRPELINTFEIVAAIVWGLAGVGFAVAFTSARPSVTSST